ncbi:MAG: ABC transporter permease subunit [Chloroflexota bacterium]|nr:ABC transporter permease subunit [Chloroflexota bacterium]
MQKYILRRILLVIPTLWLVISILFLVLNALPGDYVTIKLSNLEASGATKIEAEIVGNLEVERTLHRVVGGDSVATIAANYGATVDEILAVNPNLEADSQLRPGSTIIVIDGQLLSSISRTSRLALPEDTDSGIALLQERNPDVEFGTFAGQLFAPAEVTLTLRESTSLRELAEVNRVAPEDYLNVNQQGTPANEDGELTVDTPLYPGDTYISPTREITEASIKNQLGIDKPLGRQYVEYLWDTIRFQFRPSFQTNEPSMDIFLRSLPRTLHLNAYALIVAVIVALPVGILSAMRQDQALDYGLRGFAIMALAAPSFWIATMLIFVVSPGGIFERGIWSIPLTDESARSIFTSVNGFFALYTIPAVAGGIAAGAGLMRITRSELLEVLRQDYVRTAWSKGLRERAVIRRHALRNALVPVLSVFGLQLAALVGGNIILEVLFNIPGVGLMLLQRLYQADIPVIQTAVFFLALFVIIVNIVIDISYALIDPRIRYT